MRPLASLTLRWVSIAVGTVAVLAIAAGLVRLLPWLLSPDVPLKVSSPFARTLFSVAMEAAFMIGTPIGAAVAAAVFVERGEARALHALGVTPAGLVLRAVPRFVPASAGTLVLLLLTDVDATRPGTIARELVAEGRASCERSALPRSVSVPMVGISWLCSPGHPPRVAGSMPGTGGRIWFSASEFQLSEDLRRVTLADLRLALRRSPDLPSTRVHVTQARIDGLAPWGRPPELGATDRALVVVAIAWLPALVLGVTLLAWRVSSRPGAVLLGALPGLTGLLLLHWIDRAALSGPVYLLAPLAAASAAPAMWGLVTLVQAAARAAGLGRRWRVAGLNARC